MSEDRRARYAWTLAGLLALTALTCGLAYVPLGGLDPYVAMTIAATKALLIALVFMHLARAGGLVRAVACAGLVWMAILIGLALSDYTSRGEVEPPSFPTAR